jgi:F0F1-type ATP synthase epsilon subunit
MGGFALVKQNQITILVNEAEAAETINATEAETAFNESKQRLEAATTEKERVEATFAFKRARTRLQLVS